MKLRLLPAMVPERSLDETRAVGAPDGLPCDEAMAWPGMNPGRLGAWHGIRFAISVCRLRPVMMGALCLVAFRSLCGSPESPTRYRVVAFHPVQAETAHQSFIDEADRWLARMSVAQSFAYTFTTHWDYLNPGYLAGRQVVVFLDARPEAPAQRDAFRRYMEHGGGWMGFHYAGFALTPSEVPQNWDWYHNEFLGGGSWVGNTWKPTAAFLKAEAPGHPVLRGIPALFKSAPNEWYQWSADLRTHRDITILLSIDPSSFPLGTGPKPSEIWHDGFHPVVWTHKKYRMVYFNMGHNDMDFASKPNQPLSQTFGNEVQDRLILNALEWLGTGTVSSGQPAHR